MDSTNNTQPITDLNGNDITWINPNTIDDDKFSLHLFGHNVIDIADELNENYIRLVQNFYGIHQPINPIIGQTWFNQNDHMIYRWLGDNWVQTEYDKLFDVQIFIKIDIDESEFILDESVFNFTIDNICIYNQDMDDVKFIIDPFDSKKIILKESNIVDLYIFVFHPKDRISNPKLNKKNEIYTLSGQTQFDIESILGGTNINSLSIDLNGILLKNNEFSIINNILTIDGLVYRVKNNDLLTIWKHGGSIGSYYSTWYININKPKSYIRLPKKFKTISSIEIIDIDSNSLINPISIDENDKYIQFNFLDYKRFKCIIKVRII